MEELSDSPVVPFEGFVSADSGAIEKKWGLGSGEQWNQKPT
jgi:hypothetical protein